MGDVKVSNSKPVATEGLTLSGSNGRKLTKEEAQLANALAGLDKRVGLTQNDINKLRNMTPAQQVQYINSVLKNTGYQVAPVYDAEDETTTPGVNWTSDGLYINFSQGGRTINTDIMGDTDVPSGFLGIQFKK